MSDIHIESATIRNLFLRRRRKDLIPLFDLTVEREGDYDLRSYKALEMHDLVHILEVLNVVNTKDIPRLGCKVAFKGGGPIAIGGVVNEEWVVFHSEGYYFFTSDVEMLKFIG